MNDKLYGQKIGLVLSLFLKHVTWTTGISFFLFPIPENQGENRIQLSSDLIFEEEGEEYVKRYYGAVEVVVTD